MQIGSIIRRVKIFHGQLCSLGCLLCLNFCFVFFCKKILPPKKSFFKNTNMASAQAATNCPKSL
jgi:hypothetical protein